MLKWNVQRGVVILPKTVSKERMVQNLDIFDFTISNEDMAAISKFDTQTSLFFSHYDPSVVEWFMSLIKERRNIQNLIATKKIMYTIIYYPKKTEETEKY